jgi:hypothetical protein
MTIWIARFITVNLIAHKLSACHPCKIDWSRVACLHFASTFVNALWMKSEVNSRQHPIIFTLTFLSHHVIIIRVTLRKLPGKSRIYNPFSSPRTAI